MKRRIYCYAIMLIAMLFCRGANAQDYYDKEMIDFLRGQMNLQYLTNPYNSPLSFVYKQLVEYSGVAIPIYFGQNFTKGQAHGNGIIILDISVLSKPQPVIAFWLAHEWGHIYLGHVSNFRQPYSSYWEYQSDVAEKENEADQYSYEFLYKYKYPINEIVAELNGLPKYNADEIHMPGDVRSANLFRYYAWKASKDERYYSVQGSSAFAIALCHMINSEYDELELVERANAAGEITYVITRGLPGIVSYASTCKSAWTGLTHVIMNAYCIDATTNGILADTMYEDIKSKLLSAFGENREWQIYSGLERGEGSTTESIIIMPFSLYPQIKLSKIEEREMAMGESPEYSVCISAETLKLPFGIRESHELNENQEGDSLCETLNVIIEDCAVNFKNIVGPEHYRDGEDIDYYSTILLENTFNNRICYRGDYSKWEYWAIFQEGISEEGEAKIVFGKNVKLILGCLGEEWESRRLEGKMMFYARNNNTKIAIKIACNDDSDGYYVDISIYKYE